jgi:hypothetical protein
LILQDEAGDAYRHVTFAQDAWYSGLVGVTTMRERSIDPSTEKHAVDSCCQTGRPGDSEIIRMSNDNDQTKSPSPEFDYSAFPRNTLFHDRRNGRERRAKLITNASPEQNDPPSPCSGERRAKKERRRRIDPTTFDKQYSDDEMEFMNAVQRFKEQSGKAFPSYAEVLKVAVELGYRQFTDETGTDSLDSADPEPLADPSASSGTQM